MGSTSFSARRLVPVISVTFILATLSTSAFKLHRNTSTAVETPARAMRDIEIQVKKYLYEEEENAVLSIPGTILFMVLLCLGSGEPMPEKCNSLHSNYKHMSALKDQMDRTALISDLNLFKTYADHLKSDSIKGDLVAFVDTDVTVRKAFKEVAQDELGITFKDLDLSRKAEAVKEINNWFAEKTDHMIKDVINKDNLQGHPELLFLSAVSFKDKWAIPFNPEDTREDYFQTDFFDENEKIKMKFMSQTGEFMYADSELFEVLALPFKDSKYSLGIILMKDIFSKLDANRLAGIDLSALQFKEERIEVILPKFQLETLVDFKEEMKEDFGCAFDENCADFSIITETPIKITNLIQKVSIRIDEHGAGAVGGSDSTFVRRLASTADEETKKFTVNRPFIFTIGLGGSESEGPGLFGGIIMKPQYLE